MLLLAVAAASACQTAEPSDGGPPVVRPAAVSTTASRTPAPTPSPATTTTRPPRLLTLAFAGELLVHLPVASQARRYGAESGLAYDFGPMFDPISPIVTAADLAICHQETPLAGAGQGLSGYPLFNSPREIATGAAGAGFDRCSTASNHSLDRGPAGVVSTIDGLEAAGLTWAGTARSPEEAAPNGQIVDVAGVAVGHLAYTEWFNGLQLPADRPWMANLIEPDRILADAAAVRAAGAEFVVVSLHWGLAYNSAPTPDMVELAGTLLGSADIDLLVGHNTHMVGPIERVDGEYVLYGMGNLLSNQTAACCPAGTQDGLVAVVEVREQPAGRFAATGVRYHPTWVEPGTYRILPVVGALADEAAPAARRAALLASWDRTVAAVAQRSAEGDGVKPDAPPGVRPAVPGVPEPPR